MPPPVGSQNKGIKRSILGFIFAGCTVAFFSRIFMYSDPSYHIYHFLQTDSLLYRGRLSTLLFQLPMLFLRVFTDDVIVLSYSFGILFCYLPLIVVWLVNRIYKNADNLAFLIALTGICLSSLPAQNCFLGEHLMACQVFWVLCCYLLRFDKVVVPKFLFVSGMIFLLFYLHPVSAPLFFFLSVAFLVVWIILPAKRKLSLLFYTVFGIVGFLRTYFLFRYSERNLLDAGIIFGDLMRGDHRFFDPTRDIILLYLLLVTLAGVLIFLRGAKGIVLRYVMLCFSGILILYWVLMDAESAFYGLQLRHAIFFVSLPMYILLFLQSLRFKEQKEKIALSRHYGFQGIIVAIIFFLVVVVRSAQFHNSSKEIIRVADSFPGNCVELSQPFDKLGHSGYLKQWHFPYVYLIMKGCKRPEKIILGHGSCENFEQEKKKYLRIMFLQQKDRGLFDFSLVME